MKEIEKQELEEGVEEYEYAVEQTGFGLYNLMLLMLGGFSIMTLIVEVMAMAYILPASQCDLNLTVSDKSIISSVGFLGIVFSSLLWGFLGDLYGRKKVLIIALSLGSAFGFISSLSPNVEMFIVCRFINGFFIGCPAAVTIPYIGEFHAARYRGKVISWIGAFIAIASMYSPGLSWAILPMQWEYHIPGLDILFRPWRLLLIVFSLPSFITAMTYLKFPESPKFLWSRGKSEETLKILRTMYVINTRKPKSMFPVTKFEANKREKKAAVEEIPKSVCQLTKYLAKMIWTQTIPLFKYPLLANTLLTAFLQFGIQAGAQGVFMWVPEIFNRIAFYMEEHPDESVTLCQAYEYRDQYLISNYTDISDLKAPNCTDNVDEGVFIITLIFGAVYSCVFILMGFIIDIVGKKLLLVLILIITGTGGLLINSMQTMETIIFALGMYMMMGPCMNILFSVQVDLFPTQHRAKSVAVSQILGRLGAVVGSSLAGFLFGWNCLSVFYIFAGEYGLLIILSLLLPIPLFVRRKK